MDEEIYRFGPFILNATKRELRVDLKGRGMDLLLYLLRNRGKSIPRERILADVWKAAVTDNSLTKQLSALRTLLGDKVDSPIFIETTGDQHVKFIGDVQGPDPGGDVDIVERRMRFRVQQLDHATFTTRGLNGFSWTETPDRPVAGGAVEVLCQILEATSRRGSWTPAPEPATGYVRLAGPTFFLEWIKDFAIDFIDVITTRVPEGT